jgi:penicillin amidase
VVSAGVLWITAFGAGPVPALGPALDPGHGVWTGAADAVPPRSRALALPGLRRPARVWFTSHGVASIHAASATDAYLALGYLHARFRLAQMDLQRRLGEGRVAQLAGAAAVSSDEFELRLGLLRTAQAEWAQTPRGSPAGQALVAYARGVNDYLAQARARHDWPPLFTLAGVYPRAWTPVDSLVIQEVLTQQLDFTTSPLDYALLERSLGRARTMAWFPVIPTGQLHPYDPGPYRRHGIAPLVGGRDRAARGAGAIPDARGLAGVVTGSARAARGASVSSAPPQRDARGSFRATLRHECGCSGPRPLCGCSARPGPLCGCSASRTQRDARGWFRAASRNGGVTRAAADVLAQVRALPAGVVHQYPDSNAWAANGAAVSGGRSMLAGDPHLPQTLPPVWYQAALSAPGLAVTGVTVPGLPGVLLGRNAHIAWSLTNVQNQATLFYAERTSRRHPGEYFWRGAWRRMRQLHYTIPVAHGGPVRLTVSITVHGPVLTRAGQTTSVDWMGNVGSPDLDVLLAINRASDFAQFRAALANWRAPSQNFVYADDRGNIGAISAGYYPLVRRGDPWLPLPGTGASDVAGVIPYRAVPQIYNPPGHLVVTANQRPVGASYPYYIGTSANFFDPGYRAAEIEASLAGRHGLTARAFAAVQNGLTDPLARQIRPRLLAALAGQQLTPRQRAAARLLTGWNGSMRATSPAASVWWTFWGDYLRTVFRPWWRAARVPVRQDRGGLSVSPQQFSLDEDLATWTVSEPGNPAFTPPGAARRTAPGAMRAAFAAAVAHLAARLGGDPGSWAWGRLHRRQFPSVTGAPALGYGPRPAGSDPWAVNAADGDLIASQGPSWRMIVTWTGRSSARAEGVYPGGQSENPASPWYTDQVPAWWAGRYLPVPAPGSSPPGPASWQLRPGART